ncbi:ComEA family DNA-binding protein [Nitrospira sp. NS4]|uniref:ComEA family DNA-binding protein n=1 Tax=Nitrospira sp. NS4 TaxID=3414498 RepID=UPI003C30286E
MTLLQSCLLKLGMFAMTMGVVLWIGWQVPQALPRPALPQQAPVEQSERLDARLALGGVPQGVSDPANGLPGVLNEPQRIDLNRASLEDIEQLPGVGPVLARRVVAYRTSMGPFHKVEDLRGVKGIGQKKLERLRRLVTVVPLAEPDKGEKASI